jgi:microcystin-dependent protein
MSTEPFIGEVKIFGFNFAPRGYATCQGQILSIAQNTALFSLLGTTYGGNGQTTFALPDLQGRSPIGQGSGPGLSPISMGEVGGVENVTLILSNLPPHNHPATATSALFAEGLPGDSANPTGRMLASIPSGYLTPDVNPNKQLSTEAVTTSVTVGIAGSGLPVPIRNPFLGINYSIALQGIFPSRN